MLVFSKSIPKFVSLMRHQLVNCINTLMTAPKQGGYGLRLALPEDKA
jgi:hypothetical protein